jgi:RNA polymerase sigma factor (sigma-70 family)
MSLGANNATDYIQGLRLGDRELLVTIYKENEAMIRKYIIENNGSEEDVQDLLQDALVVVWQNARKADFVLTSKLSTYIFAIVKNLWLKQLDKNKRLTDEKAIPQNKTIPQEEHSDIDLSIVRSYLNEMGETCRQVLLMFYFDGFDMDTIAKANHFANSNVAKAKKHQCLKELSNMVKLKFSSTDFFNR